MSNIIKMVDPVKARAERKVMRRLQMDMNAAERPLIEHEKRAMSMMKQMRQERIRATTPEIDTLDLIMDRQVAIRGVEEMTNRALIELRRRLVTAEKLVATRTRERDQANKAHKLKTQGLKDTQKNLRKTLEQKDTAIRVLVAKLDKAEKLTVKSLEPESGGVVHPDNILG